MFSAVRKPQSGHAAKERGLKREERKCTEYDSEEVENVKHFLMRCKALNKEREELKEKKKKVVTGFDE